MLEEKIIHFNFNQWERISISSRETIALKKEKSDQTTLNIVDQNATPSDLNLNMLRDLYFNYKQQNAKKTKRQLKKEVISRVKTQWCCCYKMITDFIEKKCIKQYCEHRRCYYCYNFNN